MNNETSNDLPRVRISPSDLGPELFPKLISIVDNSNYWHRFAMSNIQHFEADAILRIISDFFHPINIEPVNFVRRKTDAFFFAQNCLDAIMKLVSNQLMIPNPQNDKRPIRCRIVANFCKLTSFKYGEKNKGINEIPNQEQFPSDKNNQLLQKGTTGQANKNSDSLKRHSFAINMFKMRPDLEAKIITECDNCNYWHKFGIGHIKFYETDFVLKAISDFLHPLHLTPVNVTRNNIEKINFMACNCFEAIMKIFKNQFQIPNPRDVHPMYVNVVVNFCPLDTYNPRSEDNIREIVHKRFQKEIVDLTEFHNDPELKEPCVLSDPNSLTFVIHFLQNLQPIRKIILARNGIKMLNPFSMLNKCSLRAIDLQQNQITNFLDLEPLRDFGGLIEIDLNENPVCAGIPPTVYVATLKKILPKVKIIDGVNIYEEKDRIALSPKDNFLCSYEAGDLAEQFLEYFFTVYDRSDRSKICDLYHENAIFSITCKIVPTQESSKTVMLSHYLALNRNLHCTENRSDRQVKLLFLGRNNIMGVFKRLPHSHHDPHSIKTNVIYYTEKLAVLSVYGVFLEGERYLGFSRNFVLECDKKQQYCIKNDQLHVYNALDIQVASSFQQARRIEFTHKPVPLLPKQYCELQRTFRLITNLNFDYCRRLLEEFNYDLQTALTIFIDRHLDNKIPQEAYLHDKNCQSSENKVKDIPHSNDLISKTMQCKAITPSTNSKQKRRQRRRIARNQKRKGANLNIIEFIGDLHQPGTEDLDQPGTSFNNLYKEEKGDEEYKGFNFKWLRTQDQKS